MNEPNVQLNFSATQEDIDYMQKWLAEFEARVNETQAKTQTIQDKWQTQEGKWERRFWLLFGHVWIAIGLMMIWGWTR